MKDAAPFYNDVALAPDHGAAHWLSTSDGHRIRAAHWTKDDAKGTILLFPGRTEYIEKYGRAIGEFQDRGYAVVSIDWRGQGLSDRLHAIRGMGHVAAFTDYQHDVAALVAYANDLNMPRPYMLVGHSMGGCIGLRAIYEGLDVNAVAFSAPMWGIHMSTATRPFAWTLTTLARRFGLDARIAPGQSAQNYVEKVILAENMLTTDGEMFDYMQNQIKTYGDLGLGGPSLRWLNEALREMRGLTRRPSPDKPCITFLGTDETVVDPDRIRERMARWPSGELVTIKDARHEVMMETPDTRNMVFDRTAALFDANL